MNFYNQKKCDTNGRFYDDVFIPRDFENHILRHVILNSINLSSYRPAPLMMLQGKKGEGKSYMTETVLRGNNIFYKFISSSVLSGKNEGEAVENLMLYYNSCEMDPANGKYTALVIDDFHLSIAVTKSEANHTTNADNLIEALMNIADRKKKLKAPIILIGNNFSSAYAPLTRAGRMSIYKWEPSQNDRITIVRQLLLKTSPDGSYFSWNDVSAFVQEYNNQYISFFEEVIESAVFQNLAVVTDYFAEHNGDVSIDTLCRLTEQTINKKRLSMNLLYETAERILAERNLEKLDT